MADESFRPAGVPSALRARLRALGVPLLLCGLVLAALVPIYWDGAGGLFSSRYDWRYFETLAEISRRTVVWYGQLPLWNPYSCGGEVDLANPQSLVGAPTFLFTLLFGTAWGFKLSLLTYYWLGLWGMYLLARRLTLGLYPALLAAISFGLSGYQAIHLQMGHINFASVGLFPLILYAFDRALFRWQWSVLAAALLAWVAVFGGTFTPVLIGELLFLWATVSPFLPRTESAPPLVSPRAQIVRGYLLLLALSGLALCLSAYRMLPALEFVWDHPRPLFRRTPDRSTPLQLIYDLFAWRDAGPLKGRRYWSHEYTARLPQLVAPLFLLAFVTRQTQRRRAVLALLALGLLGAALSMGNFSPVAPWSLVQSLPIARDLRVPSRHLILAVFPLVLLSALGFQNLLDWLTPRARRLAPALAALVVVLVALDAGYYTAYQFRQVFSVQLSAPKSPPPFTFIPSHWSRMREDVFGGVGVLGCDEEAPLQRAAQLDVGAVPQAKLSDPALGTVLSVVRTPLRWEVTLDLQRTDGQLLLNTNWNEHWKPDAATAKLGLPVVKPTGQLALDLRALSPGTHRVGVRYMPRSFLFGCGLSLLTWLLAAWLLWKHRRAQ